MIKIVLSSAGGINKSDCGQNVKLVIVLVKVAGCIDITCSELKIRIHHQPNSYLTSDKL